MLYIIEHLEEKLYRWCFLEYQHISKIVGKEHLSFTNLKSAAHRKKLLSFGRVEEKSVRQLYGSKNKYAHFSKTCILDPLAKEVLTPQDSKIFDTFIFGGILGNYPMQARTKKEITSKMKLPARNIGKAQMTTDNAIYVVKEIIEHGKNLEDLKFQEELVIPLKSGKEINEEIIIPFRYILVNNKPLISKKLLSYIKMKKGF
ncbi:hypothetical protein HYU21_00120 [Candidatus Woesearchaeota archaeon]|nr:hypothetical protein [Candidatus Woesearchaeota archaeon]